MATTAPIGMPEPRPFAERHDVGRDAGVLGARTSSPCGRCPDCTSSNIEQDAVLVADLRRPCEKPVRRNEVAALALRRLDHDRGDFRWPGRSARTACGCSRAPPCLVVAREERAVRIRVRARACTPGMVGKKPACCVCLLDVSESETHRAAVEAAEEGDDARRASSRSARASARLPRIPCRTGRRSSCPARRAARSRRGARQSAVISSCQ